MTCPPPLNSDRSQLMALGKHVAATATAPACSSITAGQAAASIQQPSSGDTSQPVDAGLASMIDSRSIKTRHPNAIQRQRYRDLHRTLARLTCSGDSHD